MQLGSSELKRKGLDAALATGADAVTTMAFLHDGNNFPHPAAYPPPFWARDILEPRGAQTSPWVCERYVRRTPLPTEAYTGRRLPGTLRGESSWIRPKPIYL